jgi:hypothetical protein
MGNAEEELIRGLDINITRGAQWQCIDIPRARPPLACAGYPTATFERAAELCHEVLAAATFCALRLDMALVSIPRTREEDIKPTHGFELFRVQHIHKRNHPFPRNKQWPIV